MYTGTLGHANAIPTLLQAAAQLKDKPEEITKLEKENRICLHPQMFTYSCREILEQIYPIVKLSIRKVIGSKIIPPTQEEFEEAYSWLKATQSLTEDYQDFELEF